MCAAYLISEKLANMHELEINVVDTNTFSLQKGHTKNIKKLVPRSVILKC